MSTQRRLLLTTLLLQVAILSVYYGTPSTRAQKSRIQSAEYTTPSLRLTADRNVVPACEGETKAVIVILNANPGWPQGTFARYRWTTEVGHIEGAGPNVRWDLTGVRPGRYRVYVESETGTEGRTCQVTSSTSVLLECRPVQPQICPTISILGPPKILTGQPVTFVSVLTSNASAVKPLYRWAVSAGKIIQGQGTDSIKVDTTDLEGQTITAKVSLTGYTVDCSATASLDVPVVQTCRRFDEFPLLSRNDEKARLDNFTIEMQRDPSSTSYVIIYPGQREDTRQIRTRSKAIVDYLVNSRKIDAERIVTRIGPRRDRLTIELWSCPRGIEPR